MPKKRTILISTLLVVAATAFLGMSGCNTVKGFGQDISNVADTGEKILNGEPIFYSRTAR